MLTAITSLNSSNVQATLKIQFIAVNTCANSVWQLGLIEWWGRYQGWERNVLNVQWKETQNMT